MSEFDKWANSHIGYIIAVAIVAAVIVGSVSGWFVFLR